MQCKRLLAWSLLPLCIMRTSIALAASLCLALGGLGCVAASEEGDLVFETDGGKTDVARPFGTFEQTLAPGDEGYKRLRLNEDRTYELSFQLGCETCVTTFAGTFRFATSHDKHYIVLDSELGRYSDEYELDGAKLHLRESDSDEWFTMTRVDGALELDADDNGGTFDVVEGTDVVLQLPSNPSTGYDWQITSTDRSFGYGTKTFEAAGPVGGGGTTKFVWKTAGPIPLVGEHVVKLEYRRSFETDTPAQQTFDLTVNVVAR